MSAMDAVRGEIDPPSAAPLRQSGACAKAEAHLTPVVTNALLSRPVPQPANRRGGLPAVALPGQRAALHEQVTLSEATIKVEIGGTQVMTVAEGNGPVNALDAALRKALTPAFPELDGIRLADFKVRILTPQDGTKAVTRVMIESAGEDGASWATVGVSTNVIDASYNALHDSLTYKLWRSGRRS